jgi:hypothetical protein
MYTERMTERACLSAPIPPQTLNNTAATPAAGLDMQYVKRALIHVQQGANAAGAVLTIQAIESVNANLSSPSNIAGSSALITTNSADANKQYTIEVRTDQMTKRYLGVTVTETASHAALVAGVIIGDEGDYKPANANNHSSVKTQNVL